MQPSLSFRIKPKLPRALALLKPLAVNLWFSWHHQAAGLFRRMDPELWEKLGRNPAGLLNNISQERLEALSRDGGFLAELERVAASLAVYQKAEACAILNGRAKDCLKVAYFSAEYGLAQCLPIYSGGLGMLSGDHLKSASDLNLPLTGIGLAYGQGYFSQYLNPDGWQQEEYRPNDFWSLPISLVRKDDGSELRISVGFEGAELLARVWLVQVGRVRLYLLDAGLMENPPELRAVTRQLYGGDRRMRIRQEILLGVGGVRLLKALGIAMSVLHMNEGHSAFAALEWIRMLRRDHGLSFDEAREVVKAGSCFTTHTPVPAGNDYFEPDLVKSHFEDYVRELGISMPVLLGYGRVNPRDAAEQFCMTVLALRFSSFSNGVSRLHGKVSRKMWQGVWPKAPEHDLPIDSITNGVHVPSYISKEMAYLNSRYLGEAWMEDPDSDKVWESVRRIPDSELWRVHERGRASMVSFVRKRLKKQLARRGASYEKLLEAKEALSPEALTLVFARRFATYKRATLIFKDPGRLADIVNHPQRPVQIIFAGKAHPKDEAGKDFIRQVVAMTRDERFKNRIVFIEDYDIGLARHLVRGADVWLNTPRRPLEACGTSGMKAAANGALNLSVLDGWWDEGYEPGLGWAIGAGEVYEDQNLQDEVEARNLYRLLQDEVAELFYRRGGDGLPRAWLGYMRNSMALLCPRFNSHRMLEEYVERAYLPADARIQALTAGDYDAARGLGAWVRKVRENWSGLKIESVSGPKARSLTWGEELEVTAKVRLGGLLPADVLVEAYYGPLDGAGEFMERETTPMRPEREEDGVWTFRALAPMRFTGRLGVSVRATPRHPQLSSRYSLGLMAWG